MRYILLFTVLITLIFLPFTVGAATLTVPDAGSYYYWFRYTNISGGTTVTAPRSFADKKTVIDLPMVKDSPAKGTMYILDAKTGNQAIVQLRTETSKALEYNVTRADFSYARRVKVSVTSAAKSLPAASATVKLQASGKPENMVILDPSSEGVAEFTDVPTGQAKITVEYGEGKNLSQDIDIPLDRDTPVPTIDVAVSGEIETLEAPTAPEFPEGKAGPGTPSKAGEPAPPAAATGVNFVSALIGLVLFAGILYGGYILLRNRGASVRGVLKQVGVDLPDDQPMAASAPAQPAASVDPTVCPFCGGKKDPTTGACACSVGLGSAASSPAVSTSPRLVITQGVYMGNVHPLQAGTTTIGREETNNIGLPQDNTASRRHARITAANGQFTIHDEGSSNGTFVNGMKVTEQTLRPGDEIQVGTTRMRFEA